MRIVGLGLALLAACGFEAGRLAPPPGGGDGGGGGSDGTMPPDDSLTPDTITPDWAYRRELSINNTNLGVLTDFTVSIKLDASRIRYSSAGADLRFTDANGTAIPHEIESWSTSGTSFVWVRVPAIAAGTTTVIRMYYGNPAATDAQNAAGTWDGNYIGVWHLVDAHDSTGTSTSTNFGATTRAGQVGPALNFSGTDQYVDTGNSDTLGQWTIEAWMNPDTASVDTGAASVLSRYPNYMLLWSCANITFCRKVMFDGAAVGTHNALFNATVGSWSHVVGRYNGTSLSGWTNGALVGSENTSDTADATTVTAKIGTRQDLLGDFDGGIDEVRISKTARSDDYIKAQHRSMTDTYLTFGPELTN